jgi:hypothetical protein
MTALIPFWDLANHDNGEISTDFDPETESTSCMAHKDFKTGEQVEMLYNFFPLSLMMKPNNHWKPFQSGLRI